MYNQTLLFFPVIFVLLFLLTLTTVQAAEGTEEILTKVNQYRASYGLPEVKTDLLTCSFATTRAKEISSEFTHNGFYNRIKDKSMPYPPYKLAEYTKGNAA